MLIYDLIIAALLVAKLEWECCNYNTPIGLIARTTLN